MTRSTLLMLGLAFGLSSCGVLAPLPDPEDTGSGDPATTAPPDSPEPSDSPGSAATRSLIAVGRSARQSGDHEGAAAYFEQALRIAPNDPVLWIELGETKLAQGDAAQAEAMGRKALTLVSGNEQLAARAQRLIDAN